jgi:hypothetical protein
VQRRTTPRRNTLAHPSAGEMARARRAGDGRGGDATGTE